MTIETLLGKPVGVVCAPNDSRPYAHFQRTGDVAELPVGAKLYAILDSTLERHTRLGTGTSVPKIVLIGGNHLANVLIGRLGPGFADRFPPDHPVGYAATEMDQDTYDVWCCWAAIMRARDAEVPVASNGLTIEDAKLIERLEAHAQAWAASEHLRGATLPSRPEDSITWEAAQRIKALTSPVASNELTERAHACLPPSPNRDTLTQRALREAIDEIDQLDRKLDYARDAGYMLAMALLQSDLWAKLAEDEKAAAELFLPKSQTTPGREFKSPLISGISEPKCPECGVSALRPKCLHELPPDECPRHEVARKWRERNVAGKEPT